MDMVIYVKDGKIQGVYSDTGEVRVTIVDEDRLTQEGATPFEVKELLATETQDVEICISARNADFIKLSSD